MRRSRGRGSWRKAAPTSRRHFVATTTNVAGRGRVRHHDHLRLLGLGGRPLFAVERDRAADRDRDRRRRTSARCWPARTRWTGISPTAPLERNLPVLLGLLDVWYRNFHGFASR